MRYIGNKTRLINNISDFVKDNNIKGKSFCDIFSGTGSVSDFFKSDYKIIANDFLFCSAVITRAKIYNNKEPKFKKFVDKYGIDPFNYFRNKTHIYKKHYFVTNNYSPKANRKFFSEENSIAIDSIRIEIEEIYKNFIFDEKEYYFLLGSLLESVMSFSNTSGTYEAFLKTWDKRALKKFFLSPIKINETKVVNVDNKVYNEDANSLIRKIGGDVLYIDPPYTITEYSSAYHVLETIARYDYPEVAGITARRIDNDKKSSYTRVKTALMSFEDLIRQAQFNDIIISYSNQSIIPLKELEKMLSRYSIDGKINKKLINYREYRNIRSSKKTPGLFEVLIHIKKNNEIIKSPLNYSGSKDNLMNQIHKYLPEHITTFVDVMGGAFNVGVNIIADEVIYNEYNPFVYELIKKLLKSNSKETIKYIENKISIHSLKKGNSLKYNIFRNIYNKSKKSLDLFILTTFCFQNQIRFNSSLDFNTPVGNCAYNSTIRDRLEKFKPKTKKIRFLNEDFLKINFNKYDKEILFYFDPPYFITNATYNDGKRGFNGWDADLEAKMLEYISAVHNGGFRFILSNILYHKNKENHLLLEWIESHNFNIVELQHPTRKEVLITNYNLNNGIR
ncbi:MAG TPA: DNA adenine methylase [Candidatus Paceibacterota bacterium]|jgi:adenine-specific DNA-methyltransferase|nr:DNA adenine methylase [Candidatus Paceibacterota bacterium]